MLSWRGRGESQRPEAIAWDSIFLRSSKLSQVASSNRNSRALSQRLALNRETRWLSQKLANLGSFVVFQPWPGVSPVGRWTSLLVPNFPPCALYRTGHADSHEPIVHGFYAAEEASASRSCCEARGFALAEK
jgi:hypothetical protein